MSNYTHDILEKHGKDFKFPVNFGDGMIFDYEYDWGTKTANPQHIKVRLKVKAPKREGPRKVTVRIDSFAGTSFGAVHHYAKLDLGYNHYVFAANGRPFNISVSSWNVPFGAGRLEFEVTRPVDKRDLKHDKDMARLNDSPIYGRMKLGQFTHGFWTEEEALVAAIKFFKEHFAPGWVLENVYYEDGADPVLART